jgi:ubiquinone/menaquinone biosynthesis C-methylase UbiE
MYDQSYLKNKQYHDPGNLDARIKIHSLYSTGSKDWYTFIFEQLRIKRYACLLGLGCGNAMQWKMNRKKFPNDCKIILADLSTGMISDAKEAFKGDSRFGLLSCDIQHIPFEKAYFDIVTANHMLYHVPSIHKGLEEVTRILKPKGYMMAATNGENHMLELYELLNTFENAYNAEEMKHRRFSIENGYEQLSPYFKYVIFIPYESDLWVTDIDPLISYVYSMWDVEGVISLQRKEEMYQFFKTIMEENGGLLIHKSTGIFLASNHAEGITSF